MVTVYVADDQFPDVLSVKLALVPSFVPSAMNVLKAPSLMPSTNATLTFVLVSSQLPLAHLQSPVQSVWLLLWHVFHFDKTLLRVSTPAIGLTVASATSQGEVPEFQAHSVTAAQVLFVVSSAQALACLPRAMIMCSSFAEPVIKSMKNFKYPTLHIFSSSSHSQVRHVAELQVGSV